MYTFNIIIFALFYISDTVKKIKRTTNNHYAKYACIPIDQSSFKNTVSCQPYLGAIHEHIQKMMQ